MGAGLPTATSAGLTAHKVDLARDLLDDIELSRLGPEQLLLKATRLARLTDAKEAQKWLRFELQGYVNGDPVALDYMDRTGRWTDKPNGRGYWLPLAQLEGWVAATRLEMERLQIPNINFAPSSANPTEHVTGYLGQHLAAITGHMTSITQKLDALTNQLATLTGIRSRVLSVLHGFVSTAYYELAFSGLAAGIFDSYKAETDELLRESASDALARRSARR
jgi:hypothetical protein